MVRILFGVSGEGNGHLTRSQAVITSLRKKHDIRIVASKNAYVQLKKLGLKTHKVTDLYLEYEDNRVSIAGTLWVNLKNAQKVFESLAKTVRLIRSQNIDLIVNDFSAITTFAGLWTKRKIITIDNNQIVLKGILDIPRRWRFTAFRAKIAIRAMTLTAHWRIIPAFFFPPLSSSRATLVAPILRREVVLARSSKKGKVLVYQTSDSNKDLLRVLKKIDDQFIVYGFDKQGKEKNLQFRKFSSKSFLKDLKDAKAVIMNGGFSLISECIYLKKPILSIPIEGQIEQMINAKYLQKIGIGKYIQDNDKAQIEVFLKSLLHYESNLKKLSFDYGSYEKVLQNKIEEFTE